jgi:hypothetical protein
MGTVAPPSLGLASDFNYFFGNSISATQGGPIPGLVVTIEILEPIEAQIGFDFQLNAYSPPGSTNTNWQQYVMCFTTTAPLPDDPGSPVVTYIGCSVEYFGSAAFNTHVEEVLAMPSPTTTTLPAGYVFTISLTTDPTTGNITTATFSATAGDGSTPAPPVVISIENLYPAALVPLYAFQLNMVGKNGGVYSYLAGGRGKVSYQATCPLTVSGHAPSYIELRREFTEEQANSAYGTLTFASQPIPAGTPITQSFWANLKTRIFRPGGYFAVAQQAGVANQTNLYAVNQSGRLTVFSVQDGGHWEKSAELGTINMLHPGAMPAVSQLVGARLENHLFVIDQSGQLNLFWTEGEGGGWNGPRVVAHPGTIGSGTYLAASPPARLGHVAPIYRRPHNSINQQTDVFLVDHHGRLCAFFVQSTEASNVQPEFIGALSSDGSTGNYPPSAPLAVSLQFGVTGPQVDIFLVDNNGALNVLWQVGEEPWSGPVLIDPAVTLPLKSHVTASPRFGVQDQTDLYAVDTHGRLNVFSVQGVGAWSTAVIGDSLGLKLHSGSPIAVSRGSASPDQTDVFVVDETGQIYMFSVQGTGPWSGPVPIGPQGVAPTPAESPVNQSGAFILTSPQAGVANQTDLFVMNQAGTNGPGWPTVFWQDGSGGWSGPKALVIEV